MIALLIGLLFYTDFAIYGPGAVSYAPLEMVVANRGWEGTEAFEVLVAPPNCQLLAKQGWLVTESGVYSAVVVDCADNPLHIKQFKDRRLLLDCNRKDLVYEWGWLIIR